MPKIVNEALKLLLLIFTGVCGSVVIGLMTYGTGVLRQNFVDGLLIGLGLGLGIQGGETFIYSLTHQSQIPTRPIRT